jgi:hypothetical protein
MRRRTRFLSLASAMVVAAALVLSSAPGGAASEGGCSGGTVEVKGRVKDAATTLPLDETTSVGVFQGGVGIDGLGTDSSSRWSTCLVPGAYAFNFTADHYRTEFYDDQPNVGSATPVVVAGPGPVVVNASLTPKGRVLAGRVTNGVGQPKVASVGIWRLTSVGWRPVDGIANQMPSGRWSFRVPMVGKYRVMAEVDHHTSEWFNDRTRLSTATIIDVTSATTFIPNIDLDLTYCTTSASFCRPPGFFT